MTGASGFVGGRVIHALVRQGHRVLALGRRPPARFVGTTAVEYRHWDITRGPLLTPPRVDAVVHCAALVSDWGRWEDFYAANVLGTRAVLDTFEAAPRFIHVSTVSVYDPYRPKVLVREDAPLSVCYLNHYSTTKMLAEQEVRRRRRSAVILRPHAVYGPGDTTLLPRLLRSRRLGRLIAVGDGRNRLSLTHVDNLVQAITLVLERDRDFDVFNVADGVTATLDELLRATLAALGLRPRIVYLPRRVAWSLATALERLYIRRDRPHAPPLTRYLVSQLAQEFTLDLQKARTLLDYRPEQSYLTEFGEPAARA